MKERDFLFEVENDSFNSLSKNKEQRNNNMKRRKVTPMVMPHLPTLKSAMLGSRLSGGSISEQAEDLSATPFPSESSLEEIFYPLVTKVD